MKDENCGGCSYLHSCYASSEKECLKMLEAETMTMNVVKKLTMQIDTQIEDFVVRSIKEYSGDETIVVNPKLIYEAIKKQKAMKYTIKENSYCCPVCGASIEFEDFYDKPREVVKYCVNCGQKIDWSIEQEETE